MVLDFYNLWHNCETCVYRRTKNEVLLQMMMTKNIPGSADQLMKPVPFTLPQYHEKLVTALMNGAISFTWKNLIVEEDLKVLIGGSTVQEKNWLTYFVIDDYLKLIESRCTDSQV